MSKFKENQFTAIVPVRSGSVGVKNKNFRKFSCSSLFEITLKQSINNFEKTIVTSNKALENKSIKNTVSFYSRPEKLCTSQTPMEDVIYDVIENNNIISKNIVILQATSPLRSEQLIRQAIKSFQKNNYDMIMSVCKTSSDAFKFGSIQENLFNPINKIEYCFSNRQELPILYKPTGAIYILKKEKFIKTKKLSFEKIGVVIQNEREVIDIDTEEEFLIAEKKYSAAQITK